MTQTTRQVRTGQWGADHVRRIIETGWGGIFQSIEGARDIGLDATVLDMHRGRATQYRFDLQIKTSARFSQSKPEFVVPVSEKHRRWWASLEFPVFLVCVDAPPRKPTQVYWRLITSADAHARTIMVSRQNVFGPSSRVDILSAYRRVRPSPLSAATGRLLACPLNAPMRAVAKTWYRQNMLQRPVDNVGFGPVHFTWNGWRHITRRRRSRSRILSSLLLLPSVRPVLSMPMAPTGTRPLQSAVRGRFICDSRLVIFTRPVTFVNRADAMVRIIVKQIDTRPVDWASRPPDSGECSRTYAFHSVEEAVRRR